MRPAVRGTRSRATSSGGHDALLDAPTSTSASGTSARMLVPYTLNVLVRVVTSFGTVLSVGHSPPSVAVGCAVFPLSLTTHRASESDHAHPPCVRVASSVPVHVAQSLVSLKQFSIVVVHVRAVNSASGSSSSPSLALPSSSRTFISVAESSVDAAAFTMATVTDERQAIDPSSSTEGPKVHAAVVALWHVRGTDWYTCPSPVRASVQL